MQAGVRNIRTSAGNPTNSRTDRSSRLNRVGSNRPGENSSRSNTRRGEDKGDNKPHIARDKPERWMEPRSLPRRRREA